MSLTHFWFGALALKSCASRFGAIGRWWRFEFVLALSFLAALFTMASSSACTVSWRLRRVFPTRSRPCTTLRSCARRALPRQEYSWLSWSFDVCLLSVPRVCRQESVILPCPVVNTVACSCRIVFSLLSNAVVKEIYSLDDMPFNSEQDHFVPIILRWHLVFTVTR